jgi:hypothetical protein
METEMAEHTKTDALAGLAAFIGDTDRRVSVGGTLYELAKLRPSDLAKARNHVVKCRIERHVETTQFMNFEPLVRAKALAEIECAPLSLFDVMADPDGRIKLIHLSLSRAGTPMPLAKLGETLDPTLQDELYAYVLWVSGVIKEPTLEDDPTRPPETPADMTASSGT